MTGKKTLSSDTETEISAGSMGTRIDPRVVLNRGEVAQNMLYITWSLDTGCFQAGSIPVDKGAPLGQAQR